jgi:hypothetical protein
MTRCLILVAKGDMNEKRMRITESNANLICITASFGIISKTITQLEKRGLKIVKWVG